MALHEAVLRFGTPRLLLSSAPFWHSRKPPLGLLDPHTRWPDLHLGPGWRAIPMPTIASKPTVRRRRFGTRARAVMPRRLHAFALQVPGVAFELIAGAWVPGCGLLPSAAPCCGAWQPFQPCLGSFPAVYLTSTKQMYTSGSAILHKSPKHVHANIANIHCYVLTSHLICN